MKILELFACAGGATRGLMAADNEVIATDIDEKYLAKNPANEALAKKIQQLSREVSGVSSADMPVWEPYEWPEQASRSFTLMADWEEALTLATDVDWVWASPPCQVHSATSGLTTKEYMDLIDPVRDKLKKLGVPYVIENVPGAPLKDPITLCGCMFYGLRTIRPRHFESSHPIQKHPHAANHAPIVKMGRPAKFGHRIPCQGNNANIEVTRAGMGYMPEEKVTTRVLSESIPPHFAYYIAQEMRRLL